MTKIVVLEDEKKDQDLIQETLDPFYFKYGEALSIKYYNKCTTDLTKEIEDLSERKIYILDICLNGKITGVDVAKKIREIDWDSEIIFLTNHTSYEHKVYSSIFKIFRFIEKFDNMERRLSECITLILNKECDKGMFRYKNSQMNLIIYMKDILYILRDKDDRKLIIKTTNNSFKVSKTLESILDDLDSRFKKVHRSCIANTDRVLQYEWSKGYFILDNSEKVPYLSKKHKGEVVC